MPKELPKVYHPHQVEKKIYRGWEKAGYFNPDKLSLRDKTKKFVVMMAPVNITGTLHMGHALENTLLDILVRKRRMEGYLTLWVPGTDHAGIATQNMVEKELARKGISREDLGKKKFLEKVWEWKEKYGNIILDQFRKLGISVDWSRNRFTLDSDYEEAVKLAFKHYYQKGWIYQDKRLINWCPRCATALSDLEVEHKQEAGWLWYLRYPLKKIASKEEKLPEDITVATTRPETMLGDAAVAVHPKDKRYQKLVGKKAILPLVGRELPIIADSRVDAQFGTGAVKITPAHDPLDFAIGKDHKLSLISVITKKGRMSNQAGKDFQGLKVLEAREKIISKMKEQGLLEKKERYFHNVARCYRCGSLIEPRVSLQWFLKMDKLANLAIKAVEEKKVAIYPSRWAKPYLSWLKNIKDWCISRQIWWGHSLPIWQCQRGQASYKREQRSKTPKKYFLSLARPKRCPFCGKCKPKQVSDVLDTWFSSALWPFAALGWPQKCGKLTDGKCDNPQGDLQNFYPPSLVTSAPEILYLWQARMVFSGLEFMKEAPFSTIYIHPVVLTKEGKRMSKSLGTGLDPLLFIENYGADATRFGLAWQTTGLQAIRFNKEAILGGQKFINKLWNASRFILMQKPPLVSKDELEKVFLEKKIGKAEKKILISLKKLITLVNKEIEHFRFGQALEKIYHFFWHEFCDYYLEEAKDQLNHPKSKKEQEKIKKILLLVLLASLKLLHPFIPFVTEELYQKLPLKDKKEFLMIEQWPT